MRSYIIKKMISHKFLFGSLLLAFAINIASWLSLFIKIKERSDLVILHYNLYFGIDLVGEWYRIFISPFSGLIIIIINSILAVSFFTYSSFFSYLLIISALVTQIIILLASVAVIWINI